jgi:hypothetical protein
LCQIPMSPIPFHVWITWNSPQACSHPRWTFVHSFPLLQSICFGSSCFPQNIHLGWMSLVNLVPPFGLRRPNFLLWLECNQKGGILDCILIFLLFLSQCSHTLPNLHSDTMDVYTKSTGVIAYAFIYKIPREHKLPLLPVCSSEV